jgi:hypothetical protein
MILAVFVGLTLVFASLTLAEYFQVNSLNSQLSQSKSTASQTLTSTVTVTSTAPCPSGTACGSFTYSPIGQVKVDSAQALITFPLGSGQEDVSFAVTFENVGSSPIQFVSYELNSSIPTNSAVRRETCNCGLGVSGVVTLSHGQNYTLYDPVAGNGYFYALLKGGTVDVTFSFNWATGSGGNATKNSTIVLAQFTFAPPPAA